MSPPADGGGPGGPVDLAREKDFSLGRIRVRPSIGQIVFDGATLTLQPRIMQVLVALARAEGEVVSRDDLVASCWGGVVVGDDAINRCIGRLRRLSESEAPGAFQIATLPRIGYRLIQAGETSTAEPLGAVAPARSGVPRWMWLASALAVLVLGLAGWMLWPGRPAPFKQAVALARFDSGPDPAAKTAASGVPDAVAGILSRVGLTSIPLGAASYPSDQDRDAAAARLGADMVVSGRVDGDGHRLQASAYLSDLSDHAVEWSGDFVQPDGDGPALRAQIAVKAADVIHCASTAAGAGRRRFDAKAFGLFLKACDLDHDSTAAGRSHDILVEVVKRDPDFAFAQSLLAEAAAWMAETAPLGQANSLRAEAAAAAAKALALDPHDGSPYLALYMLRLQDADFAARYSLLRKGLDLSPNNSKLIDAMSKFLGETGFNDDASRYARRAYDLDPLSPTKADNLAEILAAQGRLDEARSVFEQISRVAPRDWAVVGGRIAMEIRLGDPTLGLALLDSSRPPEWSPQLVERFHNIGGVRKDGNPALRKALGARIVDDVKAGRLSVARAMLDLTTLGDSDDAFAAASFASPSNPVPAEVIFRPQAAQMRADTRFMRLAAGAGLVAFWRSMHRWPDFCVTPGLPYDCATSASKL